MILAQYGRGPQVYLGAPTINNRDNHTYGSKVHNKQIRLFFQNHVGVII